jgi:predicted transcriptional regulator
MTRYVLKYLEEEMYIRPVDKAVVRLEEEWADSEHIIGYRLIINEKETDIVVWYADLNEWLVKKIIESGIEI